jgi:hypothetical protein
VAVLIAVGWLVLGKQIEKKFDRMDKQFQAQAAREEAKHKADLAQAADDVKAADTNTVIRVTAAQFARAYLDVDDTTGPDRIYKGKILEVTGTVREVDIKSEDEDTYRVELGTGMDDALAACEFAKTPENRARLAKLKPGDTVTIRGKCLGGGATIEACVVVE